MMNHIVRDHLLLFVSGLIVISWFVPCIEAHGRLIEPPSRASMWRYGFDTPANYNDHELYCGGFTRQWQTNGGKCGVCGDPWDSPTPRPHEAGGKYAQGVIARKYKKGMPFTIRVELTANHRGYFEFRLCPNNAPKRVVTQQCLDKYILRKARTTSRSPDEPVHETRYFPGTENKVYEIRYMLPEDVTCTQCVIQWKYIAGNNWGVCENGTGAVGCGPQEEFRACADVAIEDATGGADETPYEEATEENIIPDSDKSNNDSNDVEYTRDSENWWPFVLGIVLCALLGVLIVYALLYFYFYHAGDTVKQWWLNGGSAKFGLKSDKAGNTTVNSIPVPPPRARKHATIGFLGVPDNLV